MSENLNNKKITLNAVIFYLAFLGVLIFSFIIIFTGQKSKASKNFSSKSIVVMDIQGVMSYKTCLPLVKAVRKYSTNPNIRGMILRINSPGGTVGGVQELYRELLNFKKHNKVIVATMGDMAASGGYYLAMTADFVYANKGSMVGSVGVIINTLNYHTLAKKLGIQRVIIKAGEFKDMLNAFRPVNQKEIALLQNIVNDTYNDFFNVVKKSRTKAKLEDLKKYCDGRIFTGNFAFKNKLVDGLGGYYDAINKIKELAKIPGRPKIIEHKKSPSLNLLKLLNSSAKGKTFEEKLKYLFSNGEFNSPLYYLYIGR